MDTLAELTENLKNKMNPHYSRCWKCCYMCSLGTSISILQSWIKIPTGLELEILVSHGQYLRRMYIPIYTFHPVYLQWTIGTSMFSVIVEIGLKSLPTTMITMTVRATSSLMTTTTTTTTTTCFYRKMTKFCLWCVGLWHCDSVCLSESLLPDIT